MNPALAKALGVVGVLTFVITVLTSGPTFRSSATGLGAQVIEEATPAERVILQRGPVTDTSLREAEGWTVSCLRRQGFTVDLNGDGAFSGYSSAHGLNEPMAEGDSRRDASADECHDLSDAVSAAYYYDHASFWSWSTPLPGIGRALRELRG